MAVFLLIAAGLFALAVYRLARQEDPGRSGGLTSAPCGQGGARPLKSFGGAALLLIGAVLALIIAYDLSGHR
jgi:hypothetical protein